MKKLAGRDFEDILQVGAYHRYGKIQQLRRNVLPLVLDPHP